MANTPKDKQLYVVLVWSVIPEVPRMYKFPADKPVAAMALASQSKYINGDVLPDNHPIFRLNDWLYKHGYKYEIKKAPATGRITAVVTCGSIL